MGFTKYLKGGFTTPYYYLGTYLTVEVELVEEWMTQQSYRAMFSWQLFNYVK